MIRRSLILAALLTVSGCAGEDAGPQLAPAVLASAAGDVLAADSTGLVCEWRGDGLPQAVGGLFGLRPQLLRRRGRLHR